MRKIIIGIYIVLLSGVLVACGQPRGEISSAQTTPTEAEETNFVDKNASSSYIGDWVYDTGKGNVITFHINKGGIGSYEQSTVPDTTWDFSYEIKDEVIAMTRNAAGTTLLSTYELSDDGTNLIYVSGTFPDGTYSKQ